jgi:hypothetical protein
MPPAPGLVVPGIWILLDPGLLLGIVRPPACPSRCPAAVKDERT